MKIAALTICAALAEMGIDGSVIPALGSGPPHKALSMICPPCSNSRKRESSSDNKKKKKSVFKARVSLPASNPSTPTWYLDSCYGNY